MIEDPIVDEVHKTRERLLKEYGRDGLRQQWREIEEEFKDRVTRLKPRPPVVVDSKNP